VLDKVELFRLGNAFQKTSFGMIISFSLFLPPSTSPSSLPPPPHTPSSLLIFFTASNIVVNTSYAAPPCSGAMGTCYATIAGIGPYPLLLPSPLPLFLSPLSLSSLFSDVLYVPIHMGQQSKHGVNPPHNKRARNIPRYGHRYI
jgi:hypothetical protein